MKRCRRCDEWKDNDEFTKSKVNSDGLSSHCKACRRKQKNKWAERNRMRLREQDKERYYLRIEYYRDKRKRQYQQNRERELGLSREWKEVNGWRPKPENAKLHTRNYKARLRGASGWATLSQIEARIAYYGGQCYLRLDGCTGEYEHMDHVIPLVLGGSNWPSNQRPACGNCNTKKGGRKLEA